MLTYGLPNHRLPAHMNPRLYNNRDCISSPQETSFFKLYTFGSYSFLPRDILTLKENGFQFEEDEEGKPIYTTNPVLFPPMPTFFCDFYSGHEKKKDEPVGDGSDLFRKIIVPPTDPIQLDQEIELTVVQQKSGRKREQESIRMLVKIIFLTSGRYLKNNMEYKNSPVSGLVEFLVISQEFSYPPIAYVTPLRKRKKLYNEDPEEDLEEFVPGKKRSSNR